MSEKKIIVTLIEDERRGLKFQIETCTVSEKTDGLWAFVLYALAERNVGKAIRAVCNEVKKDKNAALLAAEDYAGKIKEGK